MSSPKDRDHDLFDDDDDDDNDNEDRYNDLFMEDVDDDEASCYSDDDSDLEEEEEGFYDEESDDDMEEENHDMEEENDAGNIHFHNTSDNGVKGNFTTSTRLKTQGCSHCSATCAATKKSMTDAALAQKAMHLDLEGFRVSDVFLS